MSRTTTSTWQEKGTETNILNTQKALLIGNSYAGFYVPYIADAFISKNDTEYFNLKGIAINDPIIGDETNQQQVVIMPYVDYFANIFYLNDRSVPSWEVY